jgi:hypothetical protein
MSTNKKFQCPCCGYYTLDDRAGTFGICPVCYWEDDIVQFNDPNYEGGANEISLSKARENFKRIGAISEEYLDCVRNPLDEEK